MAIHQVYEQNKPNDVVSMCSKKFKMQTTGICKRHGHTVFDCDWVVKIFINLNNFDMQKIMTIIYYVEIEH